MFSKALEYAFRAVLYISVKGSIDSKLSIKEIAQQIESPEPFTAKILQSLVREGVISSTKGPNGGFYIRDDAKPIPLREIMVAIDGDGVLTSCTLGLKECSDTYPCPIHYEIKGYRDRLHQVLKEKTVQQLAESIASGRSFLKNSMSI